jgi:hypothetical protein
MVYSTVQTQHIISRKYGQYHTSTFTLLSKYLNEESLFYDIVANSGINAVSIGRLVPGCKLVLTEVDEITFEVLLKNSQDNNILNRSLLLQSPQYLNLDLIYKLLYEQCPTLIKLDFPTAIDLDTEHSLGTYLLNALLDSLTVINICHPVIYLDNNYTYLSYPITSILSELPGYDVYWHVSTVVDINTTFHDPMENSILISMIAIHQSKKIELNDGFNMFRYEEGKNFISDYDLAIRYIHYSNGSLAKIGKKGVLREAATRAGTIEGIIGDNFYTIKQYDCLLCSIIDNADLAVDMERLLDLELATTDSNLQSLLFLTSENLPIVEHLAVILEDLLDPFIALVSGGCYDTDIIDNIDSTDSINGSEYIIIVNDTNESTATRNHKNDVDNNDYLDNKNDKKKKKKKYRKQ